MAEPGRRVRKIDIDDIVRVGRELGMRHLSLSAVAAELDVSTTALYRHVDGRWGLELAVGESLLDDLVLHDDPAHDATQHLLSFGLQLRAFVLANPGLGTYIQTLFPRGEAGRRLMVHEVAALARRGYTPDLAIILSSAVAGNTINYAVADENQQERAEGLEDQRRNVTNQLATDAELGTTHRELPTFTHDEYVKLVLTAIIRGLVAVAPPGRPLEQVVADLAATGMGI
ncbi:TetR/AcrR family transcriptional regulator [Rhodococcus sp. HNM0563]|nr:TetR/AcrR family transcriptional regulator [Rhodococcus sp. HNM0563]